MKIVNRHEVAKKLGMTPNALSAQVTRKNWDAIPRPAKIGGVYKWIEEEVDDWIRDRFAEQCDAASQGEGAQKRRGRPCKSTK